MQKKLFQYVVQGALCLLTFFCFPFLANAASFSDVPEGSMYFHSVEYLKSKEVISGYSDGTYKLTNPINRAEVSAILARATAGTPAGLVLNFSDVQKGDWFYDSILELYQRKIIEGYKDGTFRPHTNTTLGEALKMITLSFNITELQAPSENPYPDVDKAIWFAPHAAYTKDRHLTWSLDDGNFHPERNITRGEFALIVYRLMYIQENKLDVFPLSTDWPTFTHPTDHYLLKFPFEWIKTNAENQPIFWKKDMANGQLSFARIFPNSATAVIAVDSNEKKLALDDYLKGVAYDSKAVSQRLTLNGYPFTSINIPNTGLTDYYFELPNKSILAIYSQVGPGLNRPLLAEQMRYLIGSIRYTENTNVSNGNPSPTPPPASVQEPGDKEVFLTKVRQNILLSGKGEETLNMFQDLVLIETDTIGIGTGPVDYYYSSQYNVTLKYERDSKTLLAVNEAKGTAF